MIKFVKISHNLKIVFVFFKNSLVEISVPERGAPKEDPGFCCSSILIGHQLGSTACQRLTWPQVHQVVCVRFSKCTRWSKKGSQWVDWTLPANHSQRQVFHGIYWRRKPLWSSKSWEFSILDVWKCSRNVQKYRKCPIWKTCQKMSKKWQNFTK